MDDKCRVAPKKPPPPTPSDTDNSCAPRLPPKPMREQAKVLFAYEAQNDDELTIKEGDVITIISKEIEDLGWWKGELNGLIGVFPDNFVELIKPSSLPANDELTLPPRLKKPERPPTSEKPVNSCVPSKLGVNSSTTATIVDGHTSLSAKKPKAPAGPLKPVTKPDVVPQEVEREWKESTENGKSELENKLKHLTAERAKGPPNRRLPTFKKSVDDDSPDGIDGEDKKVELKSPEDGEEQNAPFVSELQSKLRKRNDEKRGTYSDSSLLIKITPKSPDGRTPPETTAKPNIDVVNKRHSFNPTLTETNNSSATGSSKLSNSLPNSSPVANAMQRENSASSGDNSALFKLKQLQAVVDDQREEINELKKEVKKLKEECFSRKEFEELIRAAETHVQQQISAYSSYIRTAVFQNQKKD